jgi:Ran-binding protein 3
MRDAPNGAEHAMARDHSASSSDGGRGRVLRRKRSYEDVGEEEETKSSGKRHLRKKSRDVTSPAPAGIEVPGRIGKSSVTPIDEHDGDEKMATTEAASANGQSTPSAGTSDKEGTRVSPRNKRTHDQTTSTEATDVSKDIQEAGKAQEEPNAKRPREKSDLQAPDEAEGSKTKVCALWCLNLPIV